MQCDLCKRDPRVKDSKLCQPCREMMQRLLAIHRNIEHRLDVNLDRAVQRMEGAAYGS